MITHTCAHCGCTTTEIGYDHDLHAYEVADQGHVLGRIIPDSVEASDQCRQALEQGDCPICGRWEDGYGNTCTIAGW